MRLSVKKWAEIVEISSDSTAIVQGFAIDSRKVESGFLFFALKGDSFDGHDFLEEVRDRGAAAAIVSQSFTRRIEGLELLKVPDVIEGLHKLALWKRAQKKVKTVAITGSVGKTTTKEFLSTLLEGTYTVSKTPGNANSQLGLPLSILQEGSEADVFIAEVGMTQKGHIQKLLPLITPDIAMITKISYAHTLFFPGGIEEVAQAKSEILDHPHTQKSFLHAQTQSFEAIEEKKKSDNLVFYDLNVENPLQKADVFLNRTKQGFVIHTKTEQTVPFTLPFSATHLLENFLGAALVARELGVSWESIIFQAQFLAPYKGRFEKVEKEGVIYINDSYNASPESMKAALQNLPKPKEGKKAVAVLGEMRELGRFSEEAHKEIGAIAASHVDVLLCYGEECKIMAEAFQRSGKQVSHFLLFEELKQELNHLATEGDVILLKASNSLRFWSLLES